MKKDKNGWAIIKAEDLGELLKQPPVSGKRLLEPLKTFSRENHIPFNILEDTEVTNEAEVHTEEADLWHCLQGEVVFTCGGEMVNPYPKKNKDGTVDEREIKAKEIKDGEEIFLKTGDWLWIPAGVPHTHRCEKTARLAIIKIPKV